MMAEALGPMSGSRQVAVSLDGRVPGPSAEWFRISSFVLPPPHHPGPRESSQPGCLPHALTTKSPQRGQARLLTSPYSEGRGRHS